MQLVMRIDDRHLCNICNVPGSDLDTMKRSARAVRDTYTSRARYTLDEEGEGGVLSLAGQAKGVERLTSEYQASAFLYVSGAVWDDYLEEVSPGVHP
jgi:hypothetical protein